MNTSASESIDTVQVKRDGAVFFVTINRPEVRNAVDSMTAQKLYDAFLAFENDPNASVAILTGKGNAFCAGADLKAMASGDREKLRTRGGMGSLAPMGPSRLSLSKPVIAAIEGPAVAGGMELALWADLRVVGQGGYFGVYCRRFGVPLIDLGTIRLPRLIGQSRAMDLILTGRRVDATEAYEIGLANRIAEKGQSLDTAVDLAKQLIAFPQRCMRADRASLLKQWSVSEEEAIAFELEGGLEVIASGETSHGATAFSHGKGKHGSFEWMPFALSINHAQVIGVRLSGDDQLNRMAVMRTLQALCGSQAMAMIMPEESNAMRMIDQAKGKKIGMHRP